MNLLGLHVTKYYTQTEHEMIKTNDGSRGSNWNRSLKYNMEILSHSIKTLKRL